MRDIVGAACGRPDWFFNEEKGATNMRLDKWFKVSRLIKRRTVANEACDAGRVSVNGKVQRASYDVKVGDKIEVALGQNRHTYLVKAVQEHALKEDAALMYEPLD